MNTLERTVCSVLLLLPFAAPLTLSTLAENTPVEERTCEMGNDVNFLGDSVTFKACSAWGVEVSKHVWKHTDARLVCITTDGERQRFYANEEDEFIVQCAEVRANAS